MKSDLQNWLPQMGPLADRERWLGDRVPKFHQEAEQRIPESAAVNSVPAPVELSRLERFFKCLLPFRKICFKFTLWR